METLFVNLFGSPGTGKSTMAASIFAELKWRGVDCEIVTEYAKELTWKAKKESVDIIVEKIIDLK
jgi:adenylate kinase family enzyme